MELPNHIANICGIKLTQSAKIALQAANEYEAIKKEILEDGVIQVSYRDEVIGWIAEMNEDRPDRFRALTVNGKIRRCYSYTHAFDTLLGETF